MVSSILALVRWVAIVDDDEMIRRALARLLRAHGIEAQTFSSAREYLGSPLPSAPACMILDMHLRDTMTGLELCDHLHARDAAPPIIFITAQEGTDIGVYAVSPYDVILLCKPFDPDTLLELVMQRLGSMTRTVVR